MRFPKCMYHRFVVYLDGTIDQPHQLPHHQVHCYNYCCFHKLSITTVLTFVKNIFQKKMHALLSQKQDLHNEFEDYLTMYEINHT